MLDAEHAETNVGTGIPLSTLVCPDQYLGVTFGMAPTLAHAV
jgi:hypothetical protein